MYKIIIEKVRYEFIAELNKNNLDEKTKVIYDSESNKLVIETLSKSEFSMIYVLVRQYNRAV